MDDPYKILGVARDATQDQIKTAYRKMARTHHPDLNPGNAQAEDKFKKLSAAHEVLSDPAKRARFDAGEIDATGAEKPRHRGFHPGAGGGARTAGGFKFGDNADDIFSELLRRRNRAQTGEKAWFEDEERVVRGGDAQYSLKVPFTEAMSGATKRITLPSGKALDVKVPPGTNDGSTLRLKGQGNPGRSGGPAGDALIEIKVEGDPFFTREGDDILITVPVTLPEAVLGGKVTVPTIDGRVSITVPPASNTGTVLRLKGKGVSNGSGRGDQLVTLKVVLPEHPDPDLEAFLRVWAAKAPYDVRIKAGLGG